MIRKTIIGIVSGISMSLIIAGSSFAFVTPTTGQPGAPNVQCGVGNATTEPAGFLTAGFAHAGSVYAGSSGTPSAQNANSSAALAQYDVACLRLTSH